MIRREDYTFHTQRDRSEPREIISSTRRTRRPSARSTSTSPPCRHARKPACPTSAAWATCMASSANSCSGRSLKDRGRSWAWRHAAGRRPRPPTSSTSRTIASTSSPSCRIAICTTRDARGHPGGLSEPGRVGAGRPRTGARARDPEARQLSGHRKLCYAGGVALNSVANEKLLRLQLFDDIYIMPAAEDSGTAIGAAYYGCGP